LSVAPEVSRDTSLACTRTETMPRFANFARIVAVSTKPDASNSFPSAARIGCWRRTPATRDPRSTATSESEPFLEDGAVRLFKDADSVAAFMIARVRT
jgi:hypothetical protein